MLLAQRRRLPEMDCLLRLRTHQQAVCCPWHNEDAGLFTDHHGQVSTWQPAVIETLCSSVAHGTTKTPAGNGLFTEAQNSPLLSQHGKTLFHSMVASCLYLANRTRPDILLPASYLTTRDQAPSEQDLNKLERVLQYLRHCFSS